MACNRVLTPSPCKSSPSSKLVTSLVLKYFNPPPPPFPPPNPQTFYFPLPTGHGYFCIFHTWLLATTTCSYFWSCYNWLNAVITDFYRSWNNTLKKHNYFFMCDELSFINTTQKTLKSSKKNLSIPRMDEKKLHTLEFQLKKIGGNM